MTIYYPWNPKIKGLLQSCVILPPIGLFSFTYYLLAFSPSFFLLSLTLKIYLLFRPNKSNNFTLSEFISLKYYMLENWWIRTGGISCAVYVVTALETKFDTTMVQSMIIVVCLRRLA